jgi:hypothetical protein
MRLEKLYGGGGPKSTMGCRAGQEDGPALHRGLLLAPMQCNVLCELYGANFPVLWAGFVL